MWGIPSSMKVSEEFLERFLMKYRLSIKLLVSKSFIAVGKKYDTTIGEAVLLDVVLHDTIIFMSIDSDVCIMRETEVHDIVKDAMNIWITGYTMNDMIGLYIVQPLAVV